MVTILHKDSVIPFYFVYHLFCVQELKGISKSTEGEYVCEIYNGRWHMTSRWMIVSVAGKCRRVIISFIWFDEKLGGEYGQIRRVW